MVQTVLDDETVRTKIGSIRQKKEIIKKVTRYLHAPLRYPPLTRSVANPVFVVTRLSYIRVVFQIQIAV